MSLLVGWCADVLFRFFCVSRKSYNKNNNTFNTPIRTILDACIKVFLICAGIVVRVVSFGGILYLQHGERANRLYCIPPPICENISKTNNQIQWIKTMAHRLNMARKCYDKFSRSGCVYVYIGQHDYFGAIFFPSALYIHTIQHCTETWKAINVE